MGTVGSCISSRRQLELEIAHAVTGRAPPRTHWQTLERMLVSKREPGRNLNSVAQAGALRGSAARPSADAQSLAV
eukprot:2153790-Rhodomonas_salina.2